MLDGFDLTIPAGASLAIVGQNGAGKTTLAKLLCRLYDPESGAIEIDGVDLRDLDLDDVARAGDRGVPGLRPLRAAAARQRRPARRADDAIVEPALADAGALAAGRPRTRRWPRATPAASTCPAASGSASRWPGRSCAVRRRRRRRAARRADRACSTCAARRRSSSRVLGATADGTTILVSHRFSTVRQADRICVVEHGRVIELGSHDELMALGGRYRTMYDLQAAASSRSTSTGRRSSMSRSEPDRADDDPAHAAGVPLDVRLVKLGYRAEPRPAARVVRA